jgi:hypothetical protein
MGLKARRRVATRSTAVVATVAVLTLASLSLLAWSKLAGPPPVADGPSASLDGLIVEVGETEWATMNMVMGSTGGFAVPDQMMPGAPTDGKVRLGISVTLLNTRSGTQAFDLVGEFALTGGLETEPDPLSADTIGKLSRLGPGAALQGKLYFDVAVPDQEHAHMPPLYLQWTRDGSSVRIPIQLPGGEMPEHTQH